MRAFLRDRNLVIITMTWAAIAVTSIPFERLNDDEVQYFLESQKILTLGPVVHGGLIFVPQAIAAISTIGSHQIIAARIAASLAVLGTAVVLYHIERGKSGFIAAMLFLSSFYTIRFGMRFYLDPFGAFFAVLAIYCISEGRGKLSGALIAAGAFSRQLVAPLVLVYPIVARMKKVSLKDFVLGAVAIGVLGFIWIFLADGLISSVETGTAGVATISVATPTWALGMLSGFVEFLAIAPLIVLGTIMAPNLRRRPEILPLLASGVVLALTPGFIINGAATEYPFVLNSLACIPAGAGLHRAYILLRPNGGKIVQVAVLVLLAQFAGQSYLATHFSPNSTVGIEDYGYSYDQELIAYLNSHYDGGAIYGSNRDGMLLPQISPNWVWIPQNVTRALQANPPWLVTFSSYVTVESIPPGVSVVTVGPYLVIHSPLVPLSEFLLAKNPTGRFIL